MSPASAPRVRITCDLDPNFQESVRAASSPPYNWCGAGSIRLARYFRYPSRIPGGPGHDELFRQVAFHLRAHGIDPGGKPCERLLPLGRGAMPGGRRGRWRPADVPLSGADGPRRRRVSKVLRNGNGFIGRWHPDGVDGWAEWTGERLGFEGLWNSDFGLLRLVREGAIVHGFYEATGGSTIEGRLEGDHLVFTYQEPTIRGEGRFLLAEDGLSFQGEWKPAGTVPWLPWRGTRVLPQPGVTWLVVLEAPWRRYLADREYAFGNMLREFFARLATSACVIVSSSTSRSAQKLPRPDVSGRASGARPGQPRLAARASPWMDTPSRCGRVMESLRHAADLRLVHFSACLIMQDPAVVASLRALSRQAGCRCPATPPAWTGRRARSSNSPIWK